MAIEQKYLDEYAYMGEHAYLNCCSVGMQPQRTLDFCKGYQQAFVESWGQICFGPYGRMREKTMASLASMIGASPDELMFTMNTTDGDCLLMRSYPFEAGDNVVCSHFDYPAVVYGWHQMADRGVRVKNVPDRNGMICTKDILAAMDEHTKVVAISWVQYASGFKADLKAIGRACRERGILFQVDAIQGLGRLPIDVKDCCIDVLASSAFKGLLGTFGCGFVYVNPDLVEKLSPWTWGGNIDVDEDRFPEMQVSGMLPYRGGMEKFEGGTVPTGPILTMGKSVELLAEIGFERIGEHVLSLERYFRELLADAELNATWLGSKDAKYWSGVICLRIDKKYLEPLSKALEEAKIHATIRESGVHGLFRIAIHFYNTPEHMERTARVLKAVLGKEEKHV